MSEKFPSRVEALIFLKKVGCSEKVINHCKAVALTALKTAKQLQSKGISVNTSLVEIGALLHDIGRSKKHSVDHAVIGADMAREAGLSNSIISIIKRHVGGGITATEAKKFGWKNDIYIPLTLEEKIVSYADKLMENSKIVPIENTINGLIRENKTEAAKRVQKLYEEIQNLLDDVR